MPTEAFLLYEKINSRIKVSNFSLVAFDSTAQSSYAVSVHSVESFYLIINPRERFFLPTLPLVVSSDFDGRSVGQYRSRPAARE